MLIAVALFAALAFLASVGTSVCVSPTGRDRAHFCLGDADHDQQTADSDQSANYPKSKIQNLISEVSVPKRELHPFHLQVPLRSRKQRGRKLVIRLTKDTKASVLEKSKEDYRVPTSSALVHTQKRYRRKPVWRWSVLWLSIVSLMGVTVAAGVLWLTKLPPPAHCQSISPLSSDSERLYCAQLAAESGKLDRLVAAIKLVQNWTPEHPLYSEAQRLIKEWSEAILDLAQQKIKQGDQSGAVRIASKIPVSSPLYPEAQAAVATWQQELKWSQEIIRQFKEALKVQNWSQASQLIPRLSQINQEYWNVSRVDALMRQVAAEKEAWQQLEEARELAKTNRLAQLEEAIALAGKVNPNSFVKPQALVEQSRWSRSLLEIAAGLFKNQDFAGVVNVAQRIPGNTSLSQEAQDWIQLSRASQAAKEDNILALVDALAAVNQIDAKSPLHRLATTQAALWKSQLQDHAQLKFAGAIASFDQRTALTYAIDQATRIAPGRPRRILAQTLVAQWRKEIQQIEDRNKLSQAEQLANRGTIEQLKEAVEIASKIQLGQPLRIEAQTAIAKWKRQIETIEDQPILDLAQTFAQRQDLIAAISTAGQVRPGRALHTTAQRAIAGWEAQVQIAQDRPILEAATALATQGRFDAAIATASQIPRERALYEQAQGLISSWTSQKAATDGEAQSALPEQN